MPGLADSRFLIQRPAAEEMRTGISVRIAAQILGLRILLLRVVRPSNAKRCGMERRAPVDGRDGDRTRRSIDGNEVAGPGQPTRRPGAARAVGGGQLGGVTGRSPAETSLCHWCS